MNITQNSEKYLELESKARTEIINSKSRGTFQTTADQLKLVILYYGVTTQLVRVFKKQKNYNNITVTMLEQAWPKEVQTTWGYTVGYSPTFHDYDDDMGSGFFRVKYTFKDEKETREELFFIISLGSSDYQESYILATDEVRKEFLKFIKKAIKKSRKRTISKGVYTIATVEDEYYYVKKPVKEINKNPLITPAKEILEKDIEFFFNNKEVFSCFNQTPNRKVLLAGPQGTGKSSMAYVVARKYEKDMPVVFVNNMAHADFHLRSSAKKNRSTILILEDADASLQESISTSGSQILNILDGIGLPHNKSGFYMIMTTNFPEKIENRIKKRPGRVDKIITVNTLKGEYALKCATVYMKALMDDKNKPTTKTIHEKYLPIFDGLSGAQIKDLITATRIYMAQHQVHRINVDLFKEVKEKIKDSLKSLNDMEKDLKEDMSSIDDKFGFN